MARAIEIVDNIEEIGDEAAGEQLEVKEATKQAAWGHALKGLINLANMAAQLAAAKSYRNAAEDLKQADQKARATLPQFQKFDPLATGTAPSRGPSLGNRSAVAQALIDGDEGDGADDGVGEVFPVAVRHRGNGVPTLEIPAHEFKSKFRVGGRRLPVRCLGREHAKRLGILGIVVLIQLDPKVAKRVG